MLKLEFLDEELEASSENAPLKSKLPLTPNIAEIAPIPFRQLFEGASTKAKALLAVGIFSTSVCGGVYALMFYFLGKLYDGDIEEEEDDYDMYHETCKVVFLWTMLVVAISVAGYVACYCFTHVSQEIGMAIRMQYFRAILKKDISYFDEISASELPAKMDDECALIEEGIGEKFMVFIEIVSYTIFGFVIIFDKSPEFLCIGLSLAPLNILGSLAFGFGHIKGRILEQEAYTKASAISEEALVNMRTVASFNAQEHISAEYAKHLEAATNATSAMGTIKGIGHGITWMTWMITGGVVFWVAAKWITDEHKVWVWRDELEGPDAIVCFWITGFASTHLGHLVPGIASFMEARSAGGRASYFIHEPGKIVNGTQGRSIEGTIEFRNVVFAYPKRKDKNVLQGVSFICDRGKKVAIVGDPGAGKSTIIYLLQRFYELTSGLILYGGVPITDLDISYLRKQVGYVSREPVLFDVSIEENILLGNPSASTEDVEAAAKEANAYDFIVLLQDGFNTQVGLRGSKLSGGQKQRIAIARAMVKKPKLLLLDEVTSALDNESEEVVLRTLDTIHSRQGITMISVAQKLSAVQSADKIVVLRDGRVKEEGTHEELTSRGGFYASMYASQINKAHSTTSVKERIIGASYSTNEEGSTESIPGAQNSPETYQSTSILHMFRPLLSQWPLMIVTAVSACGCGASYPILGFCVGKLITFIDGPAGDEMEGNIRTYATWLLIFGGVTFFCFFLMHSSSSLISARLTANFRECTFRKMLHLDASFFDDKSNSPHLLAHNLSHDIREMSEAIGSIFASVLLVLTAFVVCEIIAVWWQWRLGLITLVAIPIQSFIMNRGIFVRVAGIVHPKYQSATALTHDSILNMKVLRAYEAQTMMERQYLQCLESAYKETKRESVLSGMSYGTSLGMLFCLFSITYWYRGYLKIRDKVGVEECNIVAFSAFMSIIGIAISSAFAPNFANGLQSARKIYNLLDHKPAINSMDNTGLNTEIRGLINFQNVSFKYRLRDNFILNNVTFEVPMGKLVGITDTSSFGKTTISHLLLRLYDPTEGVISIDGVDIREYNIRHLRASIAVVSQEPVLFSGTVRSNVDFGLRRSDDEIKQALTAASIPRFADDLDREVGTLESLLSDGQKQRIAIARALLRSPKILLLDEATSALDCMMETKIVQTLKFAGKIKTLLIASHRLSTLESCDEIIVMDGGRIGEIETRKSEAEERRCIPEKLVAASQ